MDIPIPLHIIGHIHSDYNEKFGIPRQSGLVNSAKATVVFAPEFRNPDACRGLEGFSHIWLLWQFSQAAGRKWSPTVRPPRLGGNARMGVFATRSPFRPNAIGLSSVTLERVEYTRSNGPVLHVAGADLLNGTPILDIKPYIAYTDSHPQALGGFTTTGKDFHLEVDFPPHLLALLPEDKRQAAVEVLSQDPRPSYQEDAAKVYGMAFAGFDLRFQVDHHTLTVVAVCPREE